MRTVRNITVAVSPELYRQTRLLAAEYDTTVTGLVAYLLERMPKALKAARFPVGGPQSAASGQPQSGGQIPASTANMPTPSPSPPPEKIALSGCEAVNPNLKPSLSVTCEGKPNSGTAPVAQYAEQDTQFKRLISKLKSAYWRCNPVKRAPAAPQQVVKL
jgi:hypothetical protein